MRQFRYGHEYTDGLKRDLWSTDFVDWDIGKKGSPHVERIPPREFESSVPRWLWWALSPRNPKYVLAALVHDHFLETGYDPVFAASQWHHAARAMGVGWKTALFLSGLVCVWTVARRNVGFLK